MISIRLGFHYHVPAKQVGGQIYLPGYLGRFVGSLAGEFAQVVCFLHSPVESEITMLDYPLEHKNIRLVDLGKHELIPRRMAQAGEIRRRLQAESSEIDVMLVRAPTPLIGVLDRVLRDKPMALLIVGDYVAGLESLPQSWWRKQLIAAWSHWNKHEQMQAALRGLVFVNSRKLLEELKPKLPLVCEIRTTTLTQDDFFVREDTCQQLPIRLVYTGRLERSKGLLEIVQAVGILVDQHSLDVQLNLVGWAEKGDRILEEIYSLAERLGVQERVIYHGYKALGEELFQMYKTADIFITASQAAEGFPRTIWEAMAHSLPVVATRVGSIPDLIEGAAELVEPRSPQALAGAIIRLVEQPARRQEFIRQGRALAQSSTLEAQTGKMARQIRDWLEQ